MKKKVCFISHSPPEELGGVSIYYQNLLNYLKDKDLNITWTYSSNQNYKYSKKKIHYVELKQGKFLKYFENNFGIRKFLKENKFDIVFTTGGPWTWFYNKPINQKLMQIFHGTVYYFNKNHLKQFNLFERVLCSPLLLISWLVEKPHKKVDKIICVSNKVKKQVKNLYGKQNIQVIRTGVNLNEFKPREMPKTDKLYGLYIGGGGYWTKGLDKAIDLSREIYKLNNNYRLVVIGPDEEKVSDLIDKEFVIFLKDVPRGKMKHYYNLCDFFIITSRYEGGAPTLTTSEAMASGCLVACSKDSEQEIIKNNINGLIIDKFDKQDAKRILNNVENKEIIKNSLNTIKKLSLENWSNEYFKLLNL